MLKELINCALQEKPWTMSIHDMYNGTDLVNCVLQLNTMFAKKQMINRFFITNGVVNLYDMLKINVKIIHNLYFNSKSISLVLLTCMKS